MSETPKWTNRIVGHDEVSPDQLLANPLNFRIHPSAQQSALSGSLDSLGWIQEVLVNKNTGHVIDGHLRIQLALRNDEKSIPVTYLDLTEDEERLALLSLDPISAMAATDKEQLETLLSQVNSDDQRVQEFLSNLAKESGLTYGEQEQGDAEPQIDKAEELQKKWGVQTGDLYSIGSHKLLCGDSTKRDDVERVMDGEKARICLTDPPYGLGEKKESGKNDYDQHKDTKENLIELAKLWLPIANNISDVIVFSPGVTNAWLYPEADWIMCWFYGGGQLRSSWGFNCWQPFLCYGNDPSLASGNGGRPDAINMNTPANAKDIDHPCPKPLKLWEWFIERLSFSTDDIFYEPFCGSGTTMVACQNLSRKCRAIEISPKYCAVILQRMTDAFPGIIIEKIDSV